MLRPNKPKTSNGPMKVLNAPVHLGSMVENTDSTVEDIKSIWVVQRDDTLVNKNACLFMLFHFGMFYRKLMQRN